MLDDSNSDSDSDTSTLSSNDNETATIIKCRPIIHELDSASSSDVPLIKLVPTKENKVKASGIEVEKILNKAVSPPNSIKKSETPKRKKLVTPKGIFFLNIFSKAYSLFKNYMLQQKALLLQVDQAVHLTVIHQNRPERNLYV